MKQINLQQGCLAFSQTLTLVNLSSVWAQLSKLDLTHLTKVDLADVSQIDSAGIALLLELQAINSSRFVLVNAPASLITLLGLYNLTEILPMAEEPT